MIHRSHASPSRPARPVPMYQSRLRTAAKPQRQRRSGVGGAIGSVGAGIVRLVMALLILVAVVVVISIAGIAILFQQSNFDQPKTIVFVSAKKDQSKGKIYLAYISGKNVEMHGFQLNEQTQVPVLGGYGHYQLPAVLPLLQIEKKSPHFIRAAYSWALQRTVDQVILIPKNDEAAQLKTISQLLMHSLRSEVLLTRVGWDVIALAMFAAKNNQLEKPLETLDVAEVAEELPQEFGQSPACNVAVVNSTAKSGLATQFADVIERSNIRIIRVSDTNVTQPATLFFAQAKPECEAVLEHLQGLFVSEVEVRADEQMVNQYRADVVVLLGNDLPVLFENWPVRREN